MVIDQLFLNLRYKKRLKTLRHYKFIMTKKRADKHVYLMEYLERL